MKSWRIEFIFTITEKKNPKQQKQTVYICLSNVTWVILVPFSRLVDILGHKSMGNDRFCVNSDGSVKLRRDTDSHL